MTGSSRNQPKRRTTKPVDPDDELLTTREVAELAKVSEQTVARWRSDGDLPYLAFGYRTYRHRRGDVERLFRLRRSD